MNLDKQRIKWIAIGILIALIGVIIIQNTQVVSVRFLFWEWQMSRVLFIPLVALGGFVAGYLLARFQRRN